MVTSLSLSRLRPARRIRAAVAIRAAPRPVDGIRFDEPAATGAGLDWRRLAGRPSAPGDASSSPAPGERSPPVRRRRSRHARAPLRPASMIRPRRSRPRRPPRHRRLPARPRAADVSPCQRTRTQRASRRLRPPRPPPAPCTCGPRTPRRGSRHTPARAAPPPASRRLTRQGHRRPRRSDGALSRPLAGRHAAARRRWRRRRPPPARAGWSTRRAPPRLPHPGRAPCARHPTATPQAGAPERPAAGARGSARNPRHRYAAPVAVPPPLPRPAGPAAGRLGAPRAADRPTEVTVTIGRIEVRVRAPRTRAGAARGRPGRGGARPASTTTCARRSRGRAG